MPANQLVRMFLGSIFLLIFLLGSAGANRYGVRQSDENHIFSARHGAAVPNLMRWTTIFFKLASTRPGEHALL